MREEEYKSWLISQGTKSYENYISQTKRIEEYYGDIDEQYGKDGCFSLLAKFVYTGKDKDNRLPLRHEIPINQTSNKDEYQSYYEGTKDLATRIKKYIKFRKDIQDERLGRMTNTDCFIISDNAPGVASLGDSHQAVPVPKKSKRNARYKGNPIGNAQNFVIRTILSNLGDESFSEKDWEETRDFFKGKCAYCGATDREIVRDHAIPINRYKLGEHKLGNVVPACKSCNSKKGEHDYVEFCGEAKVAVDRINEYMTGRKYIPINEDADKSNSIRIILHKAHEEIRVVAEKYIDLINDLFFIDQ